MTQIHTLLLKLWDKAADAPGYENSEWEKLREFVDDACIREFVDDARTRQITTSRPQNLEPMYPVLHAPDSRSLPTNLRCRRLILVGPSDDRTLVIAGSMVNFNGDMLFSPTLWDMTVKPKQILELRTTGRPTGFQCSEPKLGEAVYAEKTEAIHG